ncbi:MAG: elongation factor P lysine(34) lysyltransferase, partial [Halobacteriovoraceae bacterium]|nr:elongation factor P lysine(34) lysyltransferase [Halobacteriovoraceae bacterium]
VCERFEIYLNGVEIGNCFNELTDLEIQKERYRKAKAERQKLYNQTMPEPRILLDSLNRGLPKSSGIAVGVERLLMVIAEEANPFWIEHCK